MTPRPLAHDRTSCPATRILLARLALAWTLAFGVVAAASYFGGWIGG